MTVQAGAQRAFIAERLERIPVSRYLIGLVLLIALGTFWDSYMLFSIGSIATHFESVKGQEEIAARLPIALFLGTFIGAVLLSRLADRIGRKNAFTLDLAILALGDIIAMSTSDATVLLVALFIAGLGTGAELPLSTTYAQEFAPARNRGRITSMQLTVGFAGGTVGGFVALLVVPLTHLSFPGYRIALLVPAIGALATLLIRLRVPESPRWLERRGRIEQAERITTVMEQRVMREKGLTALPEVQEQYHQPAPRGVLKTLLSRRYLRRTASAWTIELFQGFGAYGFTTFVPIILLARGYSIVHSLLYTAIIQIAYPLGTALSAVITDRIQRKWGMAVLYVVNMLCGIGFFFVRDPALVVLFGFLTELLIFLDGPLLHTYEAEIYPTHVRGSGAGFSFSLSRLGGFLAPLAGAAIIAAGGNAGDGLLIAMAAAAWILCALVAAVLAVDTRNISLEDLEVGHATPSARPDTQVQA